MLVSIRTSIFFINMDVTFREHEPYYLGSTNGPGIVLSPPVVGQEGESDSGASLSGSILVPTSGVSSPTPGVSSLDGNLSSQGEERFHNSNDNLSHGDMQDVAGHSSPYSQDVEPCMHEDSGNDDHSPSPVAPTSTIGHSDNQLSTLVPQDELPIALRKPTRTLNATSHLKDYVGYKHNIANFITYRHCSPSFQGFIASLDSTSIPKDWKVAKEDPVEGSNA